MGPSSRITRVPRVTRRATTPVGLAAADLDGDGEPDLVAVNYDPGTASVLLGTGKGLFAAKIDYPVGKNLHAIVTADLDGDGKLDLAVTSSGRVSVLRDQGKGVFSVVDAHGEGLTPRGLAAADLDGDGRPDLAVTNFLAKGGVAVLRTTCLP